MHPAAQVEIRVDGGIHPELIPDEVAYHHLFLVLARNPAMEEQLDRRRRVAYVKYYFRPDCGPQSSEDRTLNDFQLDRLLAFADGVVRRIAALEPQTTGIPTNLPGRDADAVQAARKEQQRKLVAEAVGSLPVMIDSDAAGKVHKHVLEHVKRRVRLVNVRVPYTQ